MKRRQRLSFKTVLCVFYITATISIFMVVYNVAVRFCDQNKLAVKDRAEGYQGWQYKLKLKSLNFPPSVNISDNNLVSVHALKVLQEFQGIQEVPLDELAAAKVPNTVYYVWCSNRTLEFRHFLGILSVWKIMRPTSIELHHQYPLKFDNYNNWINELQNNIPEFVTKQFNAGYYKAELESMCSFWMGLALVHDKGGIYIAPDVIVTEKILKLRRDNFTVAYKERTSEAYPEVAIIMGNSGNEKLDELRKNHYKKKVENEITCSYINRSSYFTKPGPCFAIETKVHPEDIWTLPGNFGEFARNLLYGSSNIVTPKPFLPGKIPKIVHYVWFGRKEMDFVMYLSMISTLFIANAEIVCIHGDGGLYGKYFEKVLQDPRIKIIHWEQPHYIFGKNIYNVQHMSDIIRADVLLKYGGIYVDWDVVWLHDPQDTINKGFDAVANYDHMPEPGFPNTINLGVFMAKPRSTFVKRWQDALSEYRSHDFLYNAVLLPYKIYEKYPQYLLIEKRLQVMCNFLRCHPVFHPQFKKFLQDQPFDWQTDVYSIHFTYPDPPEWSSEMKCRNNTSQFAEIGKYVLQQENKLHKIKQNSF